ncbi:unnamed protein product, partial [Cladocopium goreaui]
MRAARSTPELLLEMPDELLGHEYSGGWLVSSPRNLPGVEYELHAACLARSPLEA